MMQSKDDLKPMLPHASAKKFLLIFLAVIVISFLVAAVLANRWYKTALEPVTPDLENYQVVHVKEGMSSADITELLENRQLIKNSLAARFYLRRANVSHLLQAGTYQVSPHLTVPQIADILSRGEVATKTVRIIPGLRLDQIAEVFKEAGYGQAEVEQAFAAQYEYGILEEKPVGASLEGYLYPDTYVLPLNSSAKDLIDVMIATLDERVTQEIRNSWKAQGLNLHQGLTMASIIEKEVSKPEDQTKVAQIYLKRLKIDMRLEADPTFQYPAFLRGVEPSQDIDSPYNTYKNKGLPPGPIASSGLGALTAVGTPSDTDFLYFLSAPDGTSYFSKTIEEHEANIEKYLR